VKQFIIDGRCNAGELPDLAVFERDFEDPCMLAVGECFDLGIEHRNVWNLERRDKVIAVVDLPVAFAAEDHEIENTEQVSGMANGASRRGFANDFSCGFIVAEGDEARVP